MNTAATEAAATPLPPGFVDIATIPVEAEAPCRLGSNLPFLASNGIFTKVTKSIRTVQVRGQNLDIITLKLTLNPVHRIKPGAAVPGCNMDGVSYLFAKSVNVSGVFEVQYDRSGADPLNPNAVTGVTLAFTRLSRPTPQSSTLGVRVKFEEGVGQTANFNPKRASGTIAFP
jgi:hypothetical protein